MNDNESIMPLLELNFLILKHLDLRYDYYNLSEINIIKIFIDNNNLYKAFRGLEKAVDSRELGYKNMVKWFYNLLKNNKFDICRSVNYAFITIYSKTII